MKDNNNIDELFRKGLNQEFPYDEALWTDVENKLPTSHSKPSLWNFNLNSIVLAVVIFSYAFIQSDTAKTSESYTQNPENKESSSLTPIFTGMRVEEGNYAENVQRSNNQHFTSNNIADVDENITTSSFTENDTEDFSNAEPNNQSRKFASEEVKEIDIEINGNNNSPITSANLIEEKAEEKYVSIAKESVSDKKAYFMPEDHSKVNSNPLQNQDIIASTFDLTAANKVVVDPQRMKPLDYNLENKIYLSEPLKGKTSKILPKKREYYIEVVAARSFNLDKTTNSTRSDFVNLKENSETSLHVTNFGVNILSHYKFLTFGVGLHLSTFYENVDYKVNKEQSSYDVSYDTSFRIVNNEFNSGGNTVILVEEDITENRTPKTINVEDRFRARNEFKRIRIPLSIGYEKAFGPLSAGLSTSFVINSLYQQNGYYINEDLNSISDFNEGEEFYLLVFGHQVAASLGYSINEYIAVGARLFYEYDLNSYTKGYDSKFQSQNLGLWLRFRPK